MDTARPKATGDTEQFLRNLHPLQCTCPTVEPPRFYPCGASSFDFDKIEERERQAHWTLDEPFIARYPKSEDLSILSVCKRIREEALQSFYSVNKFFFPGSHNRYHDRQVMQWLLAPQRRKHLKKFHHIEWYAPTDELAIRSYAVIVMLVELGILVGTVVRRSRYLIDLFPARHDDPSQPIWARNRMKLNRESVNVMPATDDLIGDDKHILCGLRLAVRERIKKKRITADAVLAENIEEIEEMMCAVASKWWRECASVWCQGPCNVCYLRDQIVMGEPKLIGTPPWDKDDVPGKSQTSAEKQGLPILPQDCGTCKQRHWCP